MSGMEAAIRGALDKAGIPGAQTRRRIYDSARAALDRSLERQEVTDPERIAEHRQRLEVLIAGIEAEWTPPGVAPAPDFTAAQPAHPAAASVMPESPAHGPEAFDAVHGGPEPVSPVHAEPSWPQPPGASSRPAPMVAPVSSRSPAADGADASLDIAPDASGHRMDRVTADGSAAIAGLDGERPPHIPAAAPGKAARPTKKVKPAAPKQKRRRGLFASIFSVAVILSFLGIGLWWLIEVDALKSEAERDTGVPNPPPSLSRDDFAGGAQQLNPGAGFSGEWSNVFTPGRDGAPQVRGNASAELIELDGGDVLRIVSGTGSEDGEVLIPLGPEVMQALAGRQSVLALTVRTASPEATQIYVKCDFSVLGDCGRRRFDVTYETTDIIFSLDYDRALAPNEGGNLVINSDISGGGKGIDLVAVRIKPLT
ncbi:MAG: hypothetical protein Q8O63_03375 [Hoeflea sp.]|nr:hypothetical protein [Hoeflea sp.]